ncbi:ABC transporter [Saccharomonospora sp. CUA-673]|uniref:ABC transporter permease n=1 Tax=Saccharomonospora sp. CUA-673 TaxID=1904969 RepID=UPI000969B9E9|nr:ABC transporter permease [Saccharomonospora sp. CUA-673]OLT39987.1 ABC transporter [Saccharomonospora sp. CUA-673]
MTTQAPMTQAPTTTQASSTQTAAAFAHVTQSLTMAYRGLLRIKHDPQRLFDVVFLPIVATLLFAGVFGGAVSGSVEDYLPMLIPGVMVQIAVTASVVTGVQLRDDMDRGVFDRFRTMPISRIAPLAGSLLADIVRYVLATSITIGVGVVLGFRPESWPGLIAGCVFVIGCAFALSWIFAFMGVVMSSASAVQGSSMLVLMPLSFLSNALVPIETMPSWISWFAEINPVSHLVSTVRALSEGDGLTASAGWSLLGAVVVLAVMVPLTVRAYTGRD